MANVFGNISQNKSSNNVTTQVEAHTAALWATHKEFAIFIAILVAKDAVKIFTKLFQTNKVISNLSLLDLSFFNSTAQNFFCLIKASTLYSGIDVNAVSLPEKNADKKNKTKKTIIKTGSIWVVPNDELKFCIESIIMFYISFSR